jgi:hypothetical protein
MEKRYAKAPQPETNQRGKVVPAYVPRPEKTPAKK